MRFCQVIKKLQIGMLICALLCGGFPSLKASAAVAWPEDVTVSAGGACVMDAGSGAVLYGKNEDTAYYPASITKVMTALLVLENCSLDETVTFSETAVNGLESGAVTAYTSVGDTLSVRDCLYALLFRSANDVANALAEHVSGSVEAFADLMNARAKELGCLNTHFVNPSGLNNAQHVTTAYDMALIGRACMENAAFLEIESADTYTLGPTAKRPQGLTVTIGHKMLRSGTAYTDARVVGGKTGYTSSAGNTLVTMAEDGGRRLVTVVLQDRNPRHYLDTRSMLDLGFGSFTNVSAEELFDAEAAETRLITDTILPEGRGANHLATDRSLFVTLPDGGMLTDLSTVYDYNLPDGAPENAVAVLSFRMGSHTAGSYYLLNDRESTLSVLTESTPAKVAIVSVSLALVAGIAAFFLLGGGTAIHLHNVRVEQRRITRLHRRRRRRLESMGISEEEFAALCERERKRKEERKKHARSQSRGERGSGNV